MTSLTAIRALLRATSLLVATALAACSDDSVTAAASCSDDDCEHFVVLCTDDTASLHGGCDSDGACMSQSEATDSSCSESEVAAVTTIPAGQKAPAVGDAGAQPDTGEDSGVSGTDVTQTYSCEDNVRYYTNPVGTVALDSCTLSGTVCEYDEAKDSADCRAPVEGDPCYAEGTFGCAPDQHDALVCKSGTFESTAFDCQGEFSCVTPGHRFAACQRPDGEIDVFTLAGGPCDKEGNASCSMDRAKVNRCDAGTWVTTTHCGDAPCMRHKKVSETDYSTEVDHYYACANGGATAGDLCTTEGSAKCTTDLTGVLVCTSGKLTASRSCGAGQQCGRVVENGENLIGCRSSSYAVGEPCHFPESMRVCTSDATQVLACENGTMALHDACEGTKQCQATEEFGLPTVACL